MAEAGQPADTCAVSWSGIGAVAAGAGPGTARPQTSDGRALHGQFQHGAGPFGLDDIGAGDEVVSRHRPAVPPPQRPDVEHTAAAAIQIRLVVHRELLHTVAQIQQTKVARPDLPAARSGKELAAPFQHVDTHVVQVRAGHLARAAHADVVG